MSGESIENITKTENTFVLTLINHSLLYIKFNRHCLINNNISIPRKIINMYISYIIDTWKKDLNTDFKLGNCLLASVELTRNTNLDKYKYSSYGIGFDSRSGFSLTDASIGRYTCYNFSS